MRDNISNRITEIEIEITKYDNQLKSIIDNKNIFQDIQAEEECDKIIEYVFRLNQELECLVNKI